MSSIRRLILLGLVHKMMENKIHLKLKNNPSDFVGGAYALWLCTTTTKG
jgi:hypothetical protein